MASLIRTRVRRSGPIVVASCALVLCLAACGTGSGGSQNPSTPYNGATPWNISDGNTAPRVAQGDTAAKK
ncbi:MAG: hypothetical protein ABI277_11375 [Burkholderiaceae bacterium]